jgi:hypothetical protein
VSPSAKPPIVNSPLLIITFASALFTQIAVFPTPPNGVWPPLNLPPLIVTVEFPIT